MINIRVLYIGVVIASDLQAVYIALKYKLRQLYKLLQLREAPRQQIS